MSYMSSFLPTPARFSASEKAWMGAGMALLTSLLLIGAGGAIAGSVGSYSGAASGVGQAGTAVDQVWQMLADFVQGPMGRIITLLIIVIGVAAGIITQSLAAFAVGIGAALGLSFAPTIVEGLLGGSLQASEVVATGKASMAHTLSPVLGG